MQIIITKILKYLKEQINKFYLSDSMGRTLYNNIHIRNLNILRQNKQYYYQYNYHILSCSGNLF